MTRSPDGTRFGTVRRRAFGIMPEEKLRSAGELLTSTPVSQMDLRWQAVDKQSGLCTKNLRPLAMALDFNNTSDIRPTTITGDMHCINMANFAILHWFGMNLAPRFTNLHAQLKHLYCGPGQSYPDFLIQPVGQIDCTMIASEKTNMDHIAATLGIKEMSQSVLMRKICTLSGHHCTRKAIFEFDKLIRSIYTLRYLRDPQLQRDVHRSENRIESYHQLRSTIAQVNGKKELTGRTDLDATAPSIP